MGMSMNKLVYLASPYSAYKGGRWEAFELVSRRAAGLMLSGNLVFCPIAHSHSIEMEGMSEKQDGDWWLRQDFAVLERCDEVWVYMMPGWKESYGVQAEIDFALAHNIPVYYLAWHQEEKEAA